MALESSVCLCYRSRRATDDRRRMFTPDRPDFTRMTQATRAYADRIVSQFVGEAREEVKAALDLIHSSIETVLIYAPHYTDLLTVLPSVSMIVALYWMRWWVVHSPRIWADRIGNRV